MGKRAKISTLVCLALFAIGAQAQSTLGELLDAGYKKVTKEEFTSAVLGARVSRVESTGTQIISDYKADGTFSGAWYQIGGGGQGVYSGTWTMDETGKQCWKSKNLWFSTEGCRFWFRNGNQFYGSESESDRGSAVIKYSIKK